MSLVKRLPHEHITTSLTESQCFRATCAAGSAEAGAESYPGDKPLTIVVGFDAGGGTDAGARLMAEALEEGVLAGRVQISDVEMTAALIKPLLQDWYVKRAKYRRRGIAPERYAQSVIDFVEAAIRPSR